jgi:hypothetical protein
LLFPFKTSLKAAEMDLFNKKEENEMTSVLKNLKRDWARKDYKMMRFYFWNTSLEQTKCQNLSTICDDTDRFNLNF